jgi:hypothetical protein
MTFRWCGTSLTVIRDRYDAKVYSDSNLLHQIKTKLIEAGFDVIKKRAWKDGHMVADHVQYIRQRAGNWCLWHHSYAIRDLYPDWNNEGEVYLKGYDPEPHAELNHLLTYMKGPRKDMVFYCSRTDEGWSTNHPEVGIVPFEGDGTLYQVRPDPWSLPTKQEAHFSSPKG